MFRKIQGGEYVFHTGNGVGNNRLKDLIDFGTFSLVRLFRNLTPPSGGGWPMFALCLDRIRRDGCGCSGQKVHTTVHVYFACVMFLHVVYYRVCINLFTMF